MKNILRWVVCGLCIVVVIVCFISIVNSVAIAGRADVHKGDKSAAISTMFASIGIVMIAVGAFLVSLIQLLQNDERKLAYPILAIGGIVFLCMLLSCITASGSLKAQREEIKAARTYQNELEACDVNGLVRKLGELKIPATLDPVADAEFLLIINDTERLNHEFYDVQLFRDLLEEKGLLERIGWREEIWFQTKNAEYRSDVLRLITNFFVFSSAPIVYGIVSLVRRKEEFMIKSNTKAKSYMSY